MRVAITGASGLLGGNLAITLCEQGHDVVATRRAGSRVSHLAPWPITWADADLGDPSALVRAFRGCDIVFHAAALVSVRRQPTPAMVATNVDGTRHVLDAARDAGVARVVHTSTVSAVGLATDGSPCTETSPFNFYENGVDDGYVRTKHAAERVVATAVAGGMDVVTVNPTFMLGPYDARPSSGQLLLALAQGRLPGYTAGCNDFVDVRDVAAGMIAAAERGRTGERYILSGEGLSYQEAFRRFAAVIGCSAPRFALPRWAAQLAGWVGDLQERWSDAEPQVNSATVAWGYCDTYRFSSAKAERTLGYTYRPIEHAVADAMAWFRANGMA